MDTRLRRTLIGLLLLALAGGGLLWWMHSALDDLARARSVRTGTAEQAPRSGSR